MDKMTNVALFLEGESLERWQYDAIEYMVDNTSATISLIVINSDPHSKTTEPFSYFCGKIKRHWPWLPVWLAQAVRNILLGPPSYRESIPISDVDALAGTRRIYAEPVRVNTYSVEFRKELVDDVNTLADIGFLFGFGIVKGEILSMGRHGMVGYHHGDMSKYRGRPAGFWEFVRGEDRVGITLQRLSEELDKGEIIVYEEVSIESDDTWQDVKSKLYGHKTRDMMARAIRRLNSADFSGTPIDSPGDLYTLPSDLGTVLSYISKNLVRRLR